jgi:hypothetical protein
MQLKCELVRPRIEGKAFSLAEPGEIYVRAGAMAARLLAALRGFHAEFPAAESKRR